MIFMYHKVDVVTPTKWWVSPASLAAQLEGLRGSQFVYLDDYDPQNPNHVVLTFDDGYENVFHHAYPLLQRERIPFELFVIGDRIGGWNDYDDEEPLTRFATMEQLVEMAAGTCRIQWHSRTHPSLTEVDDEQLHRELAVPGDFRARFPSPHLNWFAYPYGLHDDRVVGAVRSCFAGAVAVAGTPYDRHRLDRRALFEESRPRSNGESER
jgi:peptidoglycan/xylan/chitin deacetylase (PgdA/CDA1 family)